MSRKFMAVDGGTEVAKCNCRLASGSEKPTNLIKIYVK